MSINLGARSIPKFLGFRDFLYFFSGLTAEIVRYWICSYSIKFHQDLSINYGARSIPRFLSFKGCAILKVSWFPYLIKFHVYCMALLYIKFFPDIPSSFWASLLIDVVILVALLNFIITKYNVISKASL